jgi:uncharacterized protein YnzC (UPF0291/DUF896 family)
VSAGARLARLLVVGAALLVAPGVAQQGPEIAYVFPAGLQRGTTVEVTVGGRSLQQVTAAWFGVGGITAEVLEKKRPMTGRERQEAQDTIEELLEKRKTQKLTSAEEQTIRELRAKIIESRREVSPQLVETVRLKLTAASDLEPGAFDLRLRTPDNLSNPLRLVVGALAERLEREDVRGEAGIAPGLPLPVVVNGRVLERDVDRFRFRVQRGTHLVAAVEARSLIPFVADAVPGWFQVCLVLRDEDGNVLRTVDDRGPDPDPVLCWVADADGICELEVFDAVYRGREDFVYRLTVGELPHVSSVFPLGAQAGTQARTMLRGVNLDSMTATVDLSKTASGVVEVATPKADIDPLLFTVDGCVDVREVEANDENPQPIVTPVAVDGIVEQPGDVDCYSFMATPGSRLVAEVMARRLGSPVDSLLRLYDPQGNEIARCDDEPSTVFGLATQAADSRLEFVVRKPGAHRLVVSDVQNKGSADHVYRLYLGPPRHDFAVRISPSTVAVASGGTAVVTVHVDRRDGFPGEVAIALVDPPPGFALGGAVVPANEDHVDVTVTAGPLEPGAVVPLEFAGRARIRSKDVTRRALPCDDRMQAFIYWHLVPAEQFLCSIRRGAGIALPMPQVGRKPLRLRCGATTEFVVEQPPRRARRAFEFVLRDPPAGVSIAKVERKTSTFVITFAVERRDELRGHGGNLIVDVRWEPSSDKDAARLAKMPPIATLPAIPFEIAR